MSGMRGKRAKKVEPSLYDSLPTFDHRAASQSQRKYRVPRPKEPPYVFDHSHGKSVQKGTLVSLREFPSQNLAHSG